MQILRFKILVAILFLILLVLVPLCVRSQKNTCENADFSQLNFTNWIGRTSVYPYNTPGTNIGTSQAPFTSPPYYFNTGIVNGRHSIITARIPDPFTCGNVMTIPPGEKQSVRLGNGGIGSWGTGTAWQRDYLIYEFSLSPSTSMLTYKYAVVLQDGVSGNTAGVKHQKELRPRFVVSILDWADKFIDSACTTREMFADSSLVHLVCDLDKAEILGGKAYARGDIAYSNWTTVTVDLRRYIGKNVKIMFETWDCGLADHFGYAYLTAKCAEMKINVNSCTPGENVTLTAPEGFSYKWLPFGQVSQSITINNAKAGDTAYVELTSANGCKTFLRTTLFRDFPQADFTPDSMVCAGSPFYFTNRSGNGNFYCNWDFGDGSTDTVQNPVHVFSKPGTYAVRLAVKTTDACTDTVIKNIFVCPSTGINDPDVNVTCKVYPNPSTGTFTLRINSAIVETIQLEITDILGRLISSNKVVTRNGSLEKELDMKNQPDGIYSLIIRGQRYNHRLRLIKEH